MLEIDDLDETGLTANSFVKMPAHQKSFLTFSETPLPKKIHFDEEQQVVIGVALATDQPIYRKDKENGEYYVMFSHQTGKQIAMKALKTGLINNISLDHNGQSVKGAYMFQSIVIDSESGITAPEAFADQDLQDGSWIVGYKVDDPKLWSQIKSKRGFSIEGMFTQKLVNNQTIKKMSKTKTKQSKSFFEMLFGSPKQEKFEEATTADGVVIMWEGELAEGTQVMIAGEDGEPVPAPAGDHLVDTMVITLDEAGMVTAITEAESDEEFDSEAFKKDLLDTLGEFTKRMDQRFDAIETKQSAFEKHVNSNGTKKKFKSDDAGKGKGNGTPAWKQAVKNQTKRK